MNLTLWIRDSIKYELHFQEAIYRSMSKILIINGYKKDCISESSLFYIVFPQ